MSNLGLQVFMTKRDVISRYQIPKHLQEELFKAMPVACMSNGKPLFFEGQVDAFLLERYPHRPKSLPYERVESARPRGGRRATTDAEAIFVLEQKKKGKSYGEILPLMRKAFPERGDFFNAGNLRKCVARYEERQARDGGERTLGINPKDPRCVSTD